MKLRIRKTLFVLFIGIVALSVSSCDQNGLNNRSGSITISLDEIGMSRSAWVPDFDMEIEYYKIIGTGPGSNRFSVENHKEATFSKDNLAPGIWDILVEGYNVEKEKIAESQSLLVKINPNKNSKVTAIVSPITGAGSFVIDINWEAISTYLNSPTVKLIFKDKYGKKILKEESYIGVEGQNSLNKTIDLHSGWYELLVQLESKEGSETKIMWQDPFPLRIVADKATNGNLTLDKNNLNLKDGALEIELKMDNPFNASFVKDRHNGTIAVGDDYFLSVLIEEEDDYDASDIQFRWYIDGEKVDGSDRYFEPIFETEGIYTISVMVLKDGALAKASTTITVVEPIILPIDNEYTIIGDDYIFQINKTNDCKEYVLELDTYNYELRTFNLQYIPIALAREPNGGKSQPERLVPLQHDNSTEVGIYYIGKLDQDIVFNFYRMNEGNSTAKIKVREASESEIPKTINFDSNNSYEFVFNLEANRQLIPFLVKKGGYHISKVSIGYSSSYGDLGNYLNNFRVTTISSHSNYKGYSQFGKWGGDFTLEIRENDTVELFILYVPAKSVVPISEDITLTITVEKD